MSYCYFFDQLPVELLHSLFVYFSTHEIVFTFDGVSNYVNDVLRTYSTWQLNFKSIRRDHFDLICRYIQPENVISLTLSDDIDTPGQSELFFRRFRIEQFSRLQSLALIKMEAHSLVLIFSDIHKLEKLRSLSFDISLIKFEWQNLKWLYTSPGERAQKNSMILNNYKQILPYLNRLHVGDNLGLTCTPMPQLRHLKLTKCWYNQLKDIFQHALFLESVDVCLELEYSVMQITLASSQLIRLRLTIESKSFLSLKICFEKEYFTN
jgi:hypothetical protein